MARDPGLEAMMLDHLAEFPGLGLTEKPMFGGWAWLLNGHMLCAARDDGALVRLGKGNEREALARDGVVAMVSRGRIISGWIRIEPDLFADPDFARPLLAQAVNFVCALPDK